MTKAYNEGVRDNCEGYWQCPYRIGSAEYNDYADGYYGQECDDKESE
jgi:hypothetical protein